LAERQHLDAAKADDVLSEHCPRSVSLTKTRYTTLGLLNRSAAVEQLIEHSPYDQILAFTYYHCVGKDLSRIKHILLKVFYKMIDDFNYLQQCTNNCYLQELLKIPSYGKVLGLVL